LSPSRCRNLGRAIMDSASAQWGDSLDLIKHTDT
jgi:hypothetical protein